METSEFYRRDRNWHPSGFSPGSKSSVPQSPQRALLSLPRSPADLSGPVFGRDILKPLDGDLIRNFGTEGGERRSANASPCMAASSTRTLARFLAR